MVGLFLPQDKVRFGRIDRRFESPFVKSGESQLPPGFPIDLFVSMLYIYVIMIRTQIQLPEEQYRFLRERAAITHQSIAGLIREAITLYTAHEKPRSTRGIRDIAGRFKPLPVKDLKPHDRWLTEAILESKRAAGSS